MTDTINGTEWNVVSIDYLRGRPRGDGDTCWLLRTREVQLGDDWFRITDLEHKSHRLAWVDTPERGQVGYDQADKDLDEWLIEAMNLGSVKAYVFGSAGWDRLLADIINANGESASQYLMRVKGWPMYVA